MNWKRNLSKFNNNITRRTFLQRASAALTFTLVPGYMHALVQKEQFVHRTAFAMGTTVSIQAYHVDRLCALNAISKAFDELFRLDSLLSVYKPESDVSRINAAAGITDVNVSPIVVDVLNQAKHFSTQTNGAFDCTIEPLMKLWGFRESKTRKIPTDKEIRSMLDAVGYQNIAIEKNSVGLSHHHASIDLGGIAVGYTVDCMADILKKEGIQSALINHSGDIFAIGAPPETDGWNVAILNPLNRSEIVESLLISNRALSTSGTSEKFVEYNGEHFGHIINTKTGLPSKIYQSLSVFAETALEADVFSTAWFCSDRETVRSQQKENRVFIVESTGARQWL